MGAKIYCQTCEKWVDIVELENYHQVHYAPVREAYPWLAKEPEEPLDLAPGFLDRLNNIKS